MLYLAVFIILDSCYSTIILAKSFRIWYVMKLWQYYSVCKPVAYNIAKSKHGKLWEKGPFVCSVQHVVHNMYHVMYCSVIRSMSMAILTTHNYNTFVESMLDIIMICCHLPQMVLFLTAGHKFNVIRSESAFIQYWKYRATFNSGIDLAMSKNNIILIILYFQGHWEFKSKHTWLPSTSAGILRNKGWPSWCFWWTIMLL